MRVTLSGKVCIVTGGTKGIGLAIARGFATAGADVAVVSRKKENLENALAELTEVALGDVIALVGHAGEAEDASRCVRQAVERFGHLDVLVNNAATNPYLGSLDGISWSQAHKTFQVNQWGPLLWTQEALRHWMAEHGGTIINIASIGAFNVDPGLGFYSATKAALLHITRQLAFELAPSIRVNAIAPGLVKTDMARALWEAREAEIAETLPLQRLGEPDDISNAALFLASPMASWLTGHVLVVDGGASIVPIDLELGSDSGYP